ncbi:hypothetical protein [Bacillus benzoevorans]|uniref:Preprotein translocase subunit SecF n=1 Tax=Bacillus benzoevorans TaxID=1456 RepID=A0A7X0HUH1_9BACI|nr:hypothetical protein [Bacillus benzoevorans]MBB6447105.1 preprotein translocase subunit SecF [Bacillus benzoevorans]
MRKVLLVFMLLFLSACGVETSQKLKGEYKIEFHTEITNTKKIKATLSSIENKYDEVMGEYKVVTFNVENRSDQAIEVQALNIFADGKRINQGSASMSQEIKPGKKEECILTLQSYASSELPPIEEKIELELHIFSWSHDFSEDYDVEIKL